MSYAPSKSHFCHRRRWSSRSTNYKLLDIAKASVAAERILDIRRRDHSDGNLVSLDVGNIGDDDMGVRVEFKNVWFKYPTRDVPVLNGLDLTVRFYRSWLRSG